MSALVVLPTMRPLVVVDVIGELAEAFVGGSRVPIGPNPCENSGDQVVVGLKSVSVCMLLNVDSVFWFDFARKR